MIVFQVVSLFTQIICVNDDITQTVNKKIKDLLSIGNNNSKK